MTLEDENRRLREALTNPAPQKLRQRIWDMLEGNAVAGNLRPGHIRGNGVPDLIWEWITTALAAEPASEEADTNLSSRSDGSTPNTGDALQHGAKAGPALESGPRKSHGAPPPPPPPQGVEEMNGEPDDRDAQIISEPLDPSELEEALSADKDDRGAEEWDLIELAAEKWLSTQGEEAKNICDCERSHNGMGMGPRECDCPAGNPPPPTQTEEETLKARVDELQTALLEPIPCDVKLPPNTILRKGVSFATLRAALYQRQGRNAEFAAEPASGEGAAVQFKSADEQRAYAEARAAAPPLPPMQGVEEIVARLERELDLRGEATLLAAQFRVLIASWRERGKALEQMRAYLAQLEERVAALRQRADAATRAENEACAQIAALNPFAHPLNTASAIRARITPT